MWHEITKKQMKERFTIQWIKAGLMGLVAMVLWNGCSGKFGWTVEVVLRPDECPTKFPVLPKRWIVERSFAWLENFRRLTIDYEFLADTAGAMVQLAFTQIVLNKFFQ